MMLLRPLLLLLLCHSSISDKESCDGGSERGCGLDESSCENDSIAFRASSTTKFCSWDTLIVDWGARIPKVANLYAIWGVGLYDGNTDQLISQLKVEHPSTPTDWSVQHTLLQKFFEEYEPTVPNIGCEVLTEWEEQEESCKDGEHWPKLVSIVASPGYGDGSNFTVKFNRNTNQPPVSDDSQVRNILSFSASIGKTLTGKWLDAKTLFVQVTESSGHVNYHEDGVSASLVRRHRRGRETRYSSLKTLLAPGPDDLHLNGSLHLRFGFQGELYVKLFVVDHLHEVARSETISVVHCKNDKNVVTLPEKRVLSPTEATSIWATPQRLALQGSRILLPRLRHDGKIAQSPYEPLDPKSWSLTFWLNLAPIGYFEGCLSERKRPFRAILYHGLGKGHESGLRTPSLWLSQTTNHLNLRVSTSNRADFGENSDISVPENEWVHVALVFENRTTEDSYFSGKVYLNGDLVINLEETTETVLAGEGYLRFMHDAWSLGPEGYVESVELYREALSRLQIHYRLQDTKPASESEPLFPAMDLDCSAHDENLNAELHQEALGTSDGHERKRKLQAAVEDGYAPSMYHLATLEENLFSEEAIALLRKAASLNNGDALFTLAMQSRLLPFFHIEPEAMGDKLFKAAFHGSIEAKLVIAHDHMRRGDCRASLSYFAQVANQAFVEHTSGGSQPLLELQTLSDFVEEKGERGDDDEHIQYHKMMAEKGDVDAMVALGGLYYWGARGLERDQSRAFRYFERAASYGNAAGQTACGNMLLKGEGVEMNRSKAMEYYRDATKQDNLEALNGLGFIYYFGNEEVEKNVTKALEYFERNLRDGDSYFNAAHIYIHEPAFRNVDKAIGYLEKAASQFGSFSATHMLGELYMIKSLDSGGVSCSKAQQYLRIAALKGSWGRKLRAGFDHFLNREMSKAAYQYLEAAYMGYSKGAENAVWLLHEKLRLLESAPYEELFELMDSPLPPLQRIARGDIAFSRGDINQALADWVSASVDGDWSVQPVYRSRASYNLGEYAMSNGQFERAEKYFTRAESFLEKDESEEAAAARIALSMARWRLYLHQLTQSYPVLSTPVKMLL